MADNGTPESYTLSQVKKMGHNPVAISINSDQDEVFVFKTEEEAQEADFDFAPEGVYVSESQLEEIDKKTLKKVYRLDEPEKKEEPAKKTTASKKKKKPALKGKDELLKRAVKGFQYYMKKGPAVFSGFRSPTLESNIIALGGSVAPRVTKSTSILIVKDVKRMTSKRATADKYGIDVMSLEHFNKIMTDPTIKKLLGL